MTDNKLENEENVPECVEIKLAYDLAVIPVLGVIFYLIIQLILKNKLGLETMSKSVWLKKATHRLWIYTGRPLVILFFIALTLLFIVIIIAPFIHSGGGGPTRVSTSRTNLETIRSAIEAYRARTGTFPGNDLRELYTVRFDIAGRMRPILRDIPPELISKKDLRPAEQNPPNRKIYNKLGDEGGWFYDPVSGKVFVNFNKPLGEEWRRYAGQNPSRW